MDSRQLLQTAAGELHGPTEQAHPFAPQFISRQAQVRQALVLVESGGQVLAGGGCEPAVPQAARREARKEMTAQPVKNPPASAGDPRVVSSIPGSGGSPGGGHGDPLQYPCLENPMDRGAWRATVCGVGHDSMIKTEINKLPRRAPRRRSSLPVLTLSLLIGQFPSLPRPTPPQ